jgi:hypothetical protein
MNRGGFRSWTWRENLGLAAGIGAWWVIGWNQPIEYMAGSAITFICMAYLCYRNREK